MCETIKKIEKIEKIEIVNSKLALTIKINFLVQQISTTDTMLKISKLTVTTKDDNKTILNNINLELKTGKIYAISGQNGSGKSTLAQVICGNPEYNCSDESQIFFDQTEIISLSPDQRSQLGIFVTMQYPTQIPGVNFLNYLKLILEISRKAKGLTKLTTKQSLDLIHFNLEILGWSKEILYRNLNEGMSGGERKKSEILQMLLLDPKLIILDEIDSGLDKQALDTIIGIIKKFINQDKTLVIITHQHKILDLIKPDQIFELKKSKINSFL